MSNLSVNRALVSPVTLSNEPPVIRLHHSKILALFRAIDSALIVSILWLGLNMLGLEWTNLYTTFAITAVIVFGFFAEGNEVYYLWRGHSMLDLAGRILFAWLVTAIFIILAALVIYPFKSMELLAFVCWLVATPVLMTGMHIGRRLLLAKLRSHPTEPRRVAIVGANELGLRLINSMKVMPWLGYKVIGFYDDRSPSHEVGRRLIGDNIEVKGGLEQLYQDAHDGKLDMVFVGLPMRAEMRMRTVIDRLADTTVSPYVIPDVFSFDLLHSRLTCLQGIPALSIYDSPLVDNGWVKRLEDVVLGAGILLLLAIPMLAVAIGVKVTSPGPVFFKQTRYGMGGEKIKVWKFRSMTVCEDGNSVAQAKRADPRITPFGNFLRRTSLDELPQLFNVLSGSMSLVGPRPHAVAHNEFYRGQIKGYMLRHKVKPGITGLAQVNGFRGETETLDKMSGRIAYDLEYIRNWSILLDIKILWKTIFKGFVGENVY
ncbi:capsular polysaccharide biosynthesis protein [Cellvibrio sp. BR]|jgi:putative colanic acid biosynthesis UDP-glucose lipid carrier transferase|uniref:undecaprenyl-phosphate glucose phosphotransferase n=1 Tax=unclassified Cellvibrio TaxID=2624793 RepID=UPI00026015E1|nr:MULTISPECIES: undecaprenyl-phosphate glucose phosphotransferase [unclassified Cellvibrio]EIK44088.1 capsular polysaccharide biosynthesis protein [Cellvibrio sp. BR]QEY13857.1 undecaprenyl-phosphate glucose phosphotransferase [Cellvibrio sp. KY-YJ-3]UUA72723.1 undecaprenyl-phosphate glucose phosphotransferase [Cellvibrio sp. QJXJ]